MPTLIIQRNPDLQKTLVDTYFAYKWKRIIRTNPVMKAYWLMGFAFLGAYAITSLPIFSIAFFLCVLMILFWAIKFFSAKGRYIRRVSSDKTAEYEFRYSGSGICYKNADYETNLAWSHFGFYEINGNAIYLYGKSNNLVDIISERICGQEHFMALKQLIEKAVLKR